VSAAPAAAGLALDAEERGLRRQTHQAIGQVTRDIDPRMHLNTAISSLMVLVNDIAAFCEARGIRPTGRDDEPPAVIDKPATAAVLREALEALIVMLSPFTPHLSEELWERFGHRGGVVSAGWPAFDAQAALADEVEIPIQVNGKLRSRITVSREASEAEIEAVALAAPQLGPYLHEADVVKVIVARGPLVNVVVRPKRGAV
jgi:leucyl-tRNA synthetase